MLPGVEAARRRAADFVATHGAPLERRRAAVLVGDAAVASLVEACTGPQDADELDGVLAVLAALDDVRALGEAPARAACDTLRAAQREDGARASRRLPK